VNFKGHANGVPFAFEENSNAFELDLYARRDASLRDMLLKAFSRIRDSQATYQSPGEMLNPLLRR
jgi:hypothetical protein